MRRRTLITALAATAAFGAAAAPAHAELRRVKVTLVTGQQLTLAVDVPPGTPVDQVAFTGLPAEVQLVEDLGPVATPVPTPVTTTTATPTPTLTPAPTSTPAQTPTAPSSTPTATPTAPPTAPADGGGAAQRRPARGNLRGNAQVLSGELRRPAATTTPAPPPPRKPDGTPTPSDPTLSVATPGPALPGVPNFFIEKFRIPPFLLPIYQAAGVEYGVRWEVLAAINEIETDYGRNLSVSSAGAVGWMQFIPSSWDLYGVDANQDGLADPYNPVDAIFSAARYLKAAGADQDLGRAIYAYNHADWYVDSVLLRARLIGGLPGDLVSSLTGLTQGRFPVAARSTYAEQLTRRELAARKDTTPARLDESDGRRKAIRIYARDGAPVIAVTDGRIVDMGRSAALGRFISLQDAYGNTYTYAGLGTVAARYPVPKRHRTTQADVRRELALPTSAPTPTHAASRTTRSELEARLSGSRRAARRATATAARPAKRSIATTRTTGTVSAVAKGTAAVAASGAPLAKDAPVKQRLFAHPDRPRAAATLVATHKAGLGKLDASLEGTRRLRRGSRVTAGTVLGSVGRPAPGAAANVRFEIRPAGRGAPRIDPKPILDGWKLLESTAVYRAKGTNPFFGPDAATPSVGQILLMGKDTLAERVLTDPHIEIYACGREDIRAGMVDQRVLATLEYLAASGLRPTVSSLECGHSYLTASGNVSEHSSGNAVDIAAINGVPIAGNQGPGSITDITIQRVLSLQGAMKPHQIISLMTFPGTDNTYSMPDHADHIHIGWEPQFGANTAASRQVHAIVKPSQWVKLISRLGQIANPQVRKAPSRYALSTSRRGSPAHKGE